MTFTPARTRTADIEPHTLSWPAAALGWLVFRIDDILRDHHRVFEFSRHPAVIFRMQLRSLDQNIGLSDGASATVGDRIIDLHLWNEHLPLLSDGSLRFARRMTACLGASLQELSAYLSVTPELDDIEVIRANMGFGTAGQTQQLARIASWYGFEAIPDTRVLGRGERLHRFGENILISLMVLARNGIALRRDTLNRSRVQVFLSRRRLQASYPGAAPANIQAAARA